MSGWSADGRNDVALVVFEAPHRLVAYAEGCADVLGDRQVVVCRELTKIHEEIRHAAVDEAIAQVRAGTSRAASSRSCFAARRGEASARRAESCRTTRPGDEFCRLTRIWARRDAKRSTRLARRLGQTGTRTVSRRPSGARLAAADDRSPMSTATPYRHSGRRQGHPDEVRTAQGAPPVGGEPMIGAALRTAAAFEPASTTVVVGHMAEKCAPSRRRIPGVATVRPGAAARTAHALLQAEPLLGGATGTVVLLYGDVPLLLHAPRVAGWSTHHQRTGAAATVLTARRRQPRRLRPHRPRAAAQLRADRRGTRRDRRGARDHRDQQRHLRLRRSAACSTRSRRIGTANAQAEYYLTDLVGIFRGRGRRVEALVPRRSRRAARRQQRDGAGRDERHASATQRNAALMAAGVTLDRSRRRPGSGRTWRSGRTRSSIRTSISKAARGSARRCEIHAGVPHRRFDVRRRRDRC